MYNYHSPDVASDAAYQEASRLSALLDTKNADKATSIWDALGCSKEANAFAHEIADTELFAANVIREVAIAKKANCPELAFSIICDLIDEQMPKRECLS